MPPRMRANQPPPVRDWRLSLRSRGRMTSSSDNRSVQHTHTLPGGSTFRDSEETIDARHSLDPDGQIKGHEACDRLLAEALEIIRALEVENQFLKEQVALNQYSLCNRESGSARGDLQTNPVATDAPARQSPLISAGTYTAGDCTQHLAMPGHLLATTKNRLSSLPVAQPNYRLCQPLYADRDPDDGPTAQLLAERDLAHTLARCTPSFDFRSLLESGPCVSLAGVDGARHISSASMQPYINYHQSLMPDAHKTTLSPISGNTSRALSPTRLIAVDLSGGGFAPEIINDGNRKLQLTDIHPVPAGHLLNQGTLEGIGKAGKQLHESFVLGHDTTERTMSPAVEAPASSQGNELPFPAQRTESEQSGLSSRFFGLFGPTIVDRPTLSSHAVHMGISINDPLAHIKWKELKQKVTLWVILTEPTWASQRHVRYTTVLSIASYINATKEFTGIHTGGTRVRGLIGRLRKEWKRRALKKKIKNQQE